MHRVFLNLNLTFALTFVHLFVGTTLCDGVYELFLQRLSISAFPSQCTL